MNTLMTILNSFLQNITYIGFMLYLAHVNLKKLFNFKFIITFSIYSLALFFIQRYDNKQLMAAFVIVLIMYILMIYINSECNLNTSINIVLFGYFFVNIAQFIVLTFFVIFNFSFNENDITDPHTLILLILSLVFIIVANHLLHFKKLSDRFCNISYASSLFFIASIIIYCIFILIRTKFSFGILISTSITLILFTILGIFILLQSFQDMKRKQALQDYDTYMPIIDTMIDNIQKRQHLYNNRILSLSQLSNTYDNYEDLCTAINEITQIDSTHKYSYDFLHLENKLLAGLLFSKTLIAENKNLNIIVTLYNYNYNSKCTDSEIVDVSGILIDNAIEACSAGDNIYIWIGHKTNNNSENKFRITVENPGPIATDEFIHKIFSKRYTTKQEKSGHGLGLSIIKTITKKYYGNISIYNSTHNETPNINYLSIEIEL